MSKKKIGILLCVMLGTIFLLVGSFLALFSSVKSDQKETQKRIVDIKSSYSKFEGRVDKFNDIRNDLYLNVFDNTYYDNMAQTDKDLKNKFKEYEKIVDEVGKSSKELKKVCGKNNFIDNSTNYKCKSYGEVYEQIVNAYVTDTKVYNNMIDSYNKYQEKQNGKSRLDKFITTKKYIDYNNDKKYDGKE